MYIFFQASWQFIKDKVIRSDTTVSLNVSLNEIKQKKEINYSMILFSSSEIDFH